MGKQNRVSGETKEERRERKRIKKEEKKQKKLVKQEAKLRQRQLKKRERDYVCQLRLAGRDISDETPAPGPAAAPAPAAQAIGALSTADQRRLQIIDESIALCWTGIRDINTFMLNAAGEVRRIQSHVIQMTEPTANFDVK